MQVSNTQPSDSFVHLHAVVDVPPGTDVTQLPVHSYFLAPNLVGDTGWPTLTISTAVDDTLAPPGKQVQLCCGILVASGTHASGAACGCTVC
jgi:hypothetical protein